MTGEEIEAVKASVEARQEALSEEELAIYREYVLYDVEQYVTDESAENATLENEKYILRCAEIIKKIRGNR